ncbi:BnaAnng06800D (plasmid) [Acetobacter orientalis]|uniref:BnaAnng06800D n=1 Tax=Acetobacter orientalis TaxID=146474 RepID=A0A2Z5ZMU0_9PROT|nr:BnaAnng06800D [Acetobacter orientalis]
MLQSYLLRRTECRDNLGPNTTSEYHAFFGVAQPEAGGLAVVICGFL